MLAEAVTGPDSLLPRFPCAAARRQRDTAQQLHRTCGFPCPFCSILVCNAASSVWLAQTAATNRRVARAGTSLSGYAPAPPRVRRSPFELELEKRNEIALRPTGWDPSQAREVHSGGGRTGTQEKTNTQQVDEHRSTKRKERGDADSIGISDGEFPKD